MPSPYPHTPAADQLSGDLPSSSLRRIAYSFPIVASVFLVVMAVLLSSEALFYMATACVVMLLACRLQSWLSVRGLSIERMSPPAVRVGELVTVHLTVRSELRTKRPLVVIRDGIVGSIRLTDLTRSLPVAPSFDQPIQTRYTFRPMQRGRFKWRTVDVVGTDALGIATTVHRYLIDQTRLTVYPMRIPVAVSIPLIGAPGGAAEVEGGIHRGTGIEPRGVREYAPGDSPRHVHWTATARMGRLIVKDFTAGTHLVANFLIQRTRNSETGSINFSSLEAMCGHALYLSEQFLEAGVEVRLPALEVSGQELVGERRLQEISEALTDVASDRPETISTELAKLGQIEGTLILMLAAQDPDLPSTLHQYPGAVCLVYNSLDYGGPRLRPAAEPKYLDQLRASGAHVIPMPAVKMAL